MSFAISGAVSSLGNTFVINLCDFEDISVFLQCKLGEDEATEMESYLCVCVCRCMCAHICLCEVMFQFSLE